VIQRRPQHAGLNSAHLIAQALRESQADKERFHRTAMLRLQQRQMSVQANLDRAYDDRLAGTISAELWSRKAGEWELELAEVRREMARQDSASHDYTVTDRRGSIGVFGGEQQAPVSKTPRTDRYLALSASAHTTCSVRTNRVCAANAGVAMVASFIRFLARISKSRPARIVKISPASLAT